MIKKPPALYLTGSRSDYGLMRTVLQELSHIFEMRIVLTGMHLSNQFGKTFSEVKKDGFKIETSIPVRTSQDSMSEMSDGIAKVITRLNILYSKKKIHLVIVLGDRWEALASTIAAAYQRIPIIHIAGGDESGGIDNYNRKAISIFATYHFVENNFHKKKLVQSGINKNRIFNVGSVGIDQIINKDFPKADKILNKYKINKNKSLILVTYHSSYEEIKNVGKNMKTILNNLSKLGKQYEKIIIYPNSDAGAQKIIRTILDFKKDNTFHVFKNIPHNEYLALMSKAALMIGNSSSVFPEGMAFKIPAINLGVRQRNRIRGKNIVDCDFKENNLKKALRLALSKNFKKRLSDAKNPYGDGKSAKRIKSILKNLNLKYNDK